MLRHGLALCFVVLSCWSALASSDEQGSREFIDSFLSKTFAVVNSENGAINDHMISDAEDILSNGIDYHRVGTLVMGNVFTIATKPQQDKLIECYRTHIIYSYLPLVIGHKRITYDIRTVQRVSPDNFIVSIDVNINRNDPQSTINMVYRVRYSDNKYGIYDIIINGASFLSMQRTYFRKLVGQMTSVDSIITKMSQDSERLRRNMQRKITAS